MTTNLEPYEANAALTLSETGGTETLTLRTGLQVDPFYVYAPKNDGARNYISLEGDLYHEMWGEGIYDEGIQWAELRLVRFGFKTHHPEFGDIVVSSDASRSACRVSLCSAGPGAKFPAMHRARFHLTATASNLPGVILQNQGVPIFLESDALYEWPPTEAIYRFKFQVPFERRDNPGEVLFLLNPGAMRACKPA